MTDDELGKLIEQGLFLGNLHGTSSKEYLGFIDENRGTPELSKLLDTAFSFKDVQASWIFEKEKAHRRLTYLLIIWLLFLLILQGIMHFLEIF